MKLRDIIIRRIHVAFLVATLLVVAVIVQMVRLQTIDRKKWNEFQEGKAIREEVIPAGRGNILSRNHKMLSSSVPRYTVRVDFQTPRFNDTLFIACVDSMAIQLNQHFGGLSVAEYKARLNSGFNNKSRAFRPIHRTIDYFDLQFMKSMSFFREKKKYTGFYYETWEDRKKPFNELASRTIGRINKDNSRGLYGLEHAYENDLRGEDGVVVTQKINGRRVDRVIKPSVDGNDIVTTIDVALQDVAETALLQQLSKNAAGHGSVVLMEVKTGDILAIANLKRGSDGVYRESYNYAIGELSEPGSTFKLASFIAALEEGAVDLDEEIETGRGVIRYYGHALKDSHDGGYGLISAKRVFEVSSNVGTSLVINNYFKSRPEDFIKRLYAMGLNQPTGIEIKGEPTPYITHPTSSTWSGISLPWMSIGYEVKMTPLQILTFYNAIANNGKMVKPRFVSEIMYNGQTVRENKVEVLKSSICSKTTLKKAHELLEGVVENGTAKNLKGSNLKIAGKTGTAQIAKGSSGYKGESGTEYSASFCGYFPAEDPQYSCIVVVKAPTRSVFYGNLVAGPVFRNIADKVYSMRPDLAKTDSVESNYEYKVPVTLDGNNHDLHSVLSYVDHEDNLGHSEATWVKTYNKKDSIQVKPLSVHNKRVPNVQGMGAKDAVYLLEKAGLKVIIKGSGRVVKQSFEPGAIIRNNKKIVIQLS